MLTYGIEFEFFVSQNNKIIPAYKATNNVDGNPFLGEIKTKPFNNILDCIFELEKLIYLEQIKLEKNKFKMEIVPINQFSKEDLITFRKDPSGINKKDIEVLEEFSIYPNGKLGSLLKRGEIKASLQINISYNKSIEYPTYNKVSVEDKYKYDCSYTNKVYSNIFNYVTLIQKLDIAYAKEISETNRVKGVYAIKDGTFGNRIEYRSLPNTIDIKSLIKILN